MKSQVALQLPSFLRTSDVRYECPPRLQHLHLLRWRRGTVLRLVRLRDSFSSRTVLWWLGFWRAVS